MDQVKRRDGLIWTLFGMEASCSTIFVLQFFLLIFFFYYLLLLLLLFSYNYVILYYIFRGNIGLFIMITRVFNFFKCE
jgi:hypothetical protein